LRRAQEREYPVPLIPRKGGDGKGRQEGRTDLVSASRPSYQVRKASIFDTSSGWEARTLASLKGEAWGVEGRGGEGRKYTEAISVSLVPPEQHRVLNPDEH
jgi:hypothetical protein